MQKSVIYKNKLYKEIKLTNVLGWDLIGKIDKIKESTFEGYKLKTDDCIVFLSKLGSNFYFITLFVS